MIRRYNKGDLSSKFVGYRVAVSVNGKLIQKYFARQYYSSFKECKKLAIQCENGLLLEQRLAEYDRIRKAKEMRKVTSPYSTGVKGIKIIMNYNRSNFMVHGSNDNKRFFIAPALPISLKDP